jgi:uncharacterized protein YqgV (UPF0045/DUF77 family)
MILDKGDSMKSALAIQCSPKNAADRAEAYRLVDQAIAVIESSGLPYMVCPFETVIEGPLDQLMDVAKRAHLAILEAGSPGVSTCIKLVSGDDIGTSEEKVGKYRARGH